MLFNLNYFLDIYRVKNVINEHGCCLVVDGCRVQVNSCLYVLRGTWNVY